MLREVIAGLAVLLATLMVVPAAAAGGSGMTIGAVEDAAKWGDPAAKMSLAREAGFGAVRMTMQWSSGQVAPSPGELQNIGNAADAARVAGIEPIVAIYNSGSASTPGDDASRAQFVQFVTAIVSGLRTVRRFVVGNEPNLNRYWLPQFNPDGSDAAAPAYEALLAASYDAIKAARPDAVVLGGALSPHGEDSPTSTRPTHSPTAFIRDLGSAYRVSGRTTPIMDVFDQHVYEDYSAMPPSFEHPTSTTIAVSDYGKLVALLGQAFDGTAQPGSTLPIFYGEYGVESIIPAAKASLYTGAEPPATQAVDEATQGALYREAFKVAYCQPNVVGIMVFHVSDESALAAWQSGPYYADDSAKSSLPAIRDAAAAARAGTLTTCPDTTPPRVTLTAPAAGAVVRGTITLRATAADDVGVGKVEWIVNGTVVAGRAVSPYSFDWTSGASGPVTITARALDAARNSATSSVSVTVDNAPPDTLLTSTPPGVGPESATFEFAASEAGSTFQCSLDGGTFASCTSPTSYTGLAPGTHGFSVRAVDAVGNVDPTPASYSWTVADTTPPDTTITDGPTGTVSATSASFSFTAGEPATFECSLDEGAYAACSSPQAYSSLAAATHTFSVRARDAAGNVDPTPATRTWTISMPPPSAHLIVTGADAGGTPQVAAFDGVSGAVLRSFDAYSAAFGGGVRVAVGDVNGDGVGDIITGAGPGGGPHVEVFDGVTGTVIRSFLAYSPAFGGGVFVAAGDVNGDGRADIITGAGAGGGPHVEVFDGVTAALIRSFFAYSPLFGGGVRVAAADLNGDGQAEIITGAGPGGGPHVEAFDGATNAVIRSFFADAPGFTGGVYVAGN